MMHLNSKLRKSPFWPIAQKVLHDLGFKSYYGDYGNKGYLRIVFKCRNPAGNPVERHYDFPPTVGSFRATENFRSQLKRFVHEDIMGRGLVPEEPDHRVRQPGGTIAHINHDKPKKELALPKSMQPPPEPIVEPPKRVSILERFKNTDPDDDVKLSMVVKRRDLETVLGVVKGSATIVGASIYFPPQKPTVSVNDQINTMMRGPRSAGA